MSDLLGFMRDQQKRNRFLEAIDHIKTLRVVCTILIVAVVALWFRNGHLQSHQRLYIPPDLTQGLETDFKTVPSATVYTFAYYIFQQLHRWKSNGEEDYPRQIYTLQGFLTPGCRATLEEDMNQKQNLGELRSRSRAVQEILGRSYSRSRVIQESESSWKTWLDLKVVESINGHPVKDVLLQYPLKIVRFDVDKEVNPWGLALACDRSMKPRLLDEDDLKSPFRRPGGQ
ncbi:PFL_4703 family integrating conjugative element protein [uncultured Pseudoteredinibacter sp.]|uniref:PFL_4703 family integrating conjugative element protein n=1 Tax=uncultured Pseudoteredinibacter sp. TaxID=1641701 RepID=UPI002631DC8F|nr:TIGR03746 family integrating conjugative element protein [uncultured Pseudoteredinibacter sp.]